MLTICTGRSFKNKSNKTYPQRLACATFYALSGKNPCVAYSENANIAFTHFFSLYL